jgi:DNA-directed RNA polymerase specialized sigma24 family protein
MLAGVTPEQALPGAPRGPHREYFHASVRAGPSAAPILMKRTRAAVMPYRHLKIPTDDSPVEQALILRLVTEMDLLRLKSIARIHARGLPPEVSWSDLLQEALARVLNGSRRVPKDVPVEVFLSGVMRSIRTEYWRRLRRDGRHWRAGEESDDDRAAGGESEPADAAPDPERALLALQQLEAIAKLFADDPVALQIIVGLADGLSADEIRAACGLTRTEYDSARKRMRRALIREGLRVVLK